MLLNNGFDVESRKRLLMVLFTQADRLDKFDSDCFSRLFEPISELKKIAERNKNIMFQAFPTACSLECMMDLDFAMVTLMLAGYAVDVQKRQEEIRAEIKAIEEQYGSGFWRYVKHLLGFDKERAKAEKRMAELQKEIPGFEKMIEKFNRLQKFYDEYEIGTFYSIKKNWASVQRKLFDL